MIVFYLFILLSLSFIYKPETKVHNIFSERTADLGRLEYYIKKFDLIGLVSILG